MKSKRRSKSATPKQGLLLNVARTIGSTLGNLAAKAEPATKHPTRPVRAKEASSKSRKPRNRRSA